MLQNPNPVIHEKLENTDLYNEYVKKRQEAALHGPDEIDALEGSILFSFAKIHYFKKSV